MNKIIYAGKHLLTFSVSTHAHSSWELIYCTQGEGRLVFDRQTIAYQKGDLVVIPPLVSHRNESEKGFTNIHLNMVDTALNIKEPTVIHDDGNHFIMDAFSAAFYHFSSNSSVQTPLLYSYASLIVCLIQTNLSSPERSPVVEEIERNIIRSYPDANFELDSYLRTLPFNYDYLRKLFKSEVGVTPHRFLSDTRLQAAAERLASTDTHSVSISDVARLCGFNEPLYFSRMFRKKYGVSPTQYQNRLQSEAQANPDSDSVKICL